MPRFMASRTGDEDIGMSGESKTSRGSVREVEPCARDELDEPLCPFQVDLHHVEAEKLVFVDLVLLRSAADLQERVDDRLLLLHLSTAGDQA